MKRHTLETIIFLAVAAAMIYIAGSMTYGFITSWGDSPEPEPTPVVVVEQTQPTPIEVQRFPSVEAYFKHGNPNPLSHRLGLPNYERDVSRRLRADVLQRDQSCLVCGSTYMLECDHRIALMNGGSNEITNLGTLCDSCHVEKTRYDWSIHRRRRKELEKVKR